MSKKKRKTKAEIRYINQQAVYIHKEISHTKKDYYTLDVRRTNNAMHNLSGTAFKLYIYLNQNPNNKSILLSTARFCELSGMSPRSCVLAKQELTKKRYLVLREDGDYDFYNHPYRNHNETVFEKLDRIKGGSATNNPSEEDT